MLELYRAQEKEALSRAADTFSDPFFPLEYSLSISVFVEFFSTFGGLEISFFGKTGKEKKMISFFSTKNILFESKVSEP